MDDENVFDEDLNFESFNVFNPVFKFPSYVFGFEFLNSRGYEIERQVVRPERPRRNYPRGFFFGKPYGIAQLDPRGWLAYINRDFDVIRRRQDKLLETLILLFGETKEDYTPNYEVSHHFKSGVPLPKEEISRILGMHQKANGSPSLAHDIDGHAMVTYAKYWTESGLHVNKREFLGMD